MNGPKEQNGSELSYPATTVDEGNWHATENYRATDALRADLPIYSQLNFANFGEIERTPDEETATFIEPARLLKSWGLTKIPPRCTQSTITQVLSEWRKA
jgi:hypothetical protein